MNFKNQYIINPNIAIACSKILANISINHSNAKLVLNKTKYNPQTTQSMIRMSKRFLNGNKGDTIFRLENIDFKMIYCPSGIFIIGSNDSNDEYSKRSALVGIKKPFLLGETEVTQELFEEVMGYKPSEFRNKKDAQKRPVESVNWYEAVMFCNKLSVKLGKRPYYNISNEIYETESFQPNIESADVTENHQANGFRLPKEKEWEYAAKSSTNSRYAGTNTKSKLENVAWFDKNSPSIDKKGGKAIRQTHTVGGKKPNKWGFYDMSGNVYEWCWDKFKSSFATRVVRGGSYNFDDRNATTFVRAEVKASDRYSFIGFRIAASLDN